MVEKETKVVNENKMMVNMTKKHCMTSFYSTHIPNSADFW